MIGSVRCITTWGARAAQARARAEERAGRCAAWRVHAYGAELRLEEARVPPLRAPDELLVRVHAASVNPIDVAMVGGYGASVLNALRRVEGAGDAIEFPLVPGRDFVGEVMLAGPATRLRAGAYVWGALPPQRAGAHAQLVAVRERWVSAAPRAMAVTTAAGAPYAALSATAALRAAGLPPGTPASGARVLVLGLGGVGYSALQLLLHAGAQVWAGARGAGGARAAALGARVLDPDAHDYERRLVAGGPYEVILDCAGLGGAQAARLPWRYARYVTLTSPLLRETDERGLACGLTAAAGALVAQGTAAALAHPSPPACLPAQVRWAFFAARDDDLRLLSRLADRGQFDVAVERVFPWREAAAAYARAAAGHARGKLVLDFCC